IITPQRQVIDQEVDMVTVPSVDGDITVLPKHAHLLTLLQEGIITMKHGNKEENLAIGGGYLETNGKEANILVSRAYNQDEIDEKLTEEAIQKAKQVLADVKDEKQRLEAASTLRRSIIDMKLVKRRKNRVL
ncbi:MAG: ATP synthase F1 subunit epsilon, partial [Patescibacteria group bacterium]